MKTIFRNLGLGVLMAGCVAATATQNFAQDATAAADVCKEVEPKQVLYKQFTDNIPKNPTIQQTETAIKAGDDYVQKYGACPEDKPIVDYLNTYLPGMKKNVVKIKGDEETKKLSTRFDTAVKGTNNVANASETYASGKEVVALNNDLQLDVLLTLGSVGYDQAAATPAVDTYNNDTVQYAKMAIQKLEADAPSKTGNYGVYQYSYKNKEYADGKANALGAMNYNIGYILYYRQGKDNAEKKKEALSYLYKSTQYNSFAKKNPFLYQTIGAWYLDQALKSDADRTALLKSTGAKEDTPETLAMVANQKGYADRAIDAYARAYKIAKDDKTSKKEYVDGLYTKMKDLYAFRYDGKTEGIDTFVASVQNNPLPDPMSAITPVKEETPAPATTTTGTTTTTPAATTPATTTAKPATTTTAPNTTKPATTPAVKKPVSTTIAPADGTVVEKSTTKIEVKKTAPKKKGTR